MKEGAGHCTFIGHLACFCVTKKSDHRYSATSDVDDVDVTLLLMHDNSKNVLVANL